MFCSWIFANIKTKLKKTVLSGVENVKHIMEDGTLDYRRSGDVWSGFIQHEQFRSKIVFKDRRFFSLSVVFLFFLMKSGVFTIKLSACVNIFYFDFWVHTEHRHPVGSWKCSQLRFWYASVSLLRPNSSSDIFGVIRKIHKLLSAELMRISQ